jgi:hypothetical protein
LDHTDGLVFSIQKVPGLIPIMASNIREVTSEMCLSDTSDNVQYSGGIMGDGVITNRLQIARQLLWSSVQNSWLQIQRSGFDSRSYQIF